MSLCFRTIHNRVASLVNTRQQVTKIDCQLPKHTKPSAFLEEFLGPRSTVTPPIFSKNRVCEVPAVSTIFQNIVYLPLDNSNNSVSALFKAHNVQQNESNLSEEYRVLPLQQLRINTIKIANDTITHNVLQKHDITFSEPSPEYNKISTSSLDRSSATNERLYNIQCRPKSKEKIVWNASANQESNEPARKDDPRRPSPEQLEHIFTTLSKELPNFYCAPMDFGIYAPNMIFINNIKGTVTEGRVPYMKQMTLLKILGHIKFAHVQMDVLKITVHPEDDSVKVRWRICGTSFLAAFFRLRGTFVSKNKLWYDGFSTFYVNGDGLISKHVADKVMPDQDYEKVKPPPIAAKLALFTGLIDGSNIFNYEKYLSKFCFSTRITQAK